MVNKLYPYIYCLVLFALCLLFLGSAGNHSQLTFKSYLPVFSLQLTGFALLVYLVSKFAIPLIKNAIKSKKEKTDEFLQSLEQQIKNYTSILANLQEQLKNIQDIIEERKNKRKKEIEKIALAVEKELEELKNRISSRIKLEEELEVLRLKIFLTDFVKTKISEFVKSNLTDKDLKNVQLKYEEEFIEKFLQLKKDEEFINKLKSL
ncbi:MAG: hypothetical protein ACK4NF_02960 [Planctomycetota bacterium]